jgi:hypothetical protein
VEKRFCQTRVLGLVDCQLVGGSGSQVFFQTGAIEFDAAIPKSIAKALTQRFKRVLGSK